VPAGCYRNRDHYAPFVSFPSVAGDRLIPLFDPQTSGGLLIALAPKSADCFLSVARDRGLFAVAVGEVLPQREHAVAIV